MKQVITRIDDKLHSRLKAHAASEHRSVNSVVNEAIESMVASGRVGLSERRSAAETIASGVDRAVLLDDEAWN